MKGKFFKFPAILLLNGEGILLQDFLLADGLNHIFF
jgi:hypothetical protein